jgi:Phage integrase family
LRLSLWSTIRTCSSASIPVSDGRNRWVCDGRTSTFSPGSSPSPEASMGGQGGSPSTQWPVLSCWTLAAPGSVRQCPAVSGRPDRTRLCPKAKIFFPAALQRAAVALKKAEVEAPHLDEYTWHGNRHTFASRLAMADVNLLTIKEVGGWRTLAMVQRYAHLAPGHLQDAVERLVSPQGGAVELARN